MAKETKIRRVKAKESEKTAVAKDSKKTEMSKYAAKVAGVKPKKAKKSLPKWLSAILTPFKIFAPINRYFIDSWRELKLVRWPTRKETWKMTAAVLIFSITFAIFVVVLDGLFTFMFKSILGK